jgi:aromatic-L-amino-acid decarboxylase
MFMAAPGLAAIEEQAVRWLCDIAGFPKGAGGVITSGGSAATFTAIHTARTATLSGEKAKHFFKATAYMSTETHLCIEQGLFLCGFPKENVRKIEVDENFRIQTDWLAETIERDMAAGCYPFLLIGNAGTANTGAVDDLAALETMARQYKMWFHVDAAYGGFFMLTQKGQELMKGIEKADSIVLDPHKSLFLPYGTGAVLVKDKTNLLTAFDFTGTYLPPLGKQGAADPLPDDIMYCSQEVTRDFRGFRIWLPLKMLGIKPFREQLEEKLKLARWMAAQLSEIPDIRILSQPQLSVIAFKFEPLTSHVSAEVLDEMNKLFLDAINRRGNIFLSPFKVGKAAGQFALRMAILSHRTTSGHLRQGLSDIQEALDEVLTLIKSN